MPVANRVVPVQALTKLESIPQTGLNRELNSEYKIFQIVTDMRSPRKATVSSGAGFRRYRRSDPVGAGQTRARGRSRCRNQAAMRGEVHVAFRRPLASAESRLQRSEDPSCRVQADLRNDFPELPLEPMLERAPLGGSSATTSTTHGASSERGSVETGFDACRSAAEHAAPSAFSGLLCIHQGRLSQSPSRKEFANACLESVRHKRKLKSTGLSHFVSVRFSRVVRFANGCDSRHAPRSLKSAATCPVRRARSPAGPAQRSRRNPPE